MKELQQEQHGLQHQSCASSVGDVRSRRGDGTGGQLRARARMGEGSDAVPAMSWDPRVTGF